MDIHKIATIYPLLPDGELQAFAEDIRQHGQRLPIITYENQILDGRNRYKACELAGVKPRYESFIGTALDAVAYVVSANEKRRHLTSSQAAACEYKRLELLDEYRAAVEAARDAAKARQEAGQQRGGKTAGQGRPKHPDSSSQTFDSSKPSTNKGKTAATRAKAAKTNRQYIHDVAALAAVNPAVVDELIAGTVTIPQAPARCTAPPWRPPVVVTFLTGLTAGTGFDPGEGTAPARCSCTAGGLSGWS